MISRTKIPPHIMSVWIVTLSFDVANFSLFSYSGVLLSPQS
jgi:hypothetical protein